MLPLPSLSASSSATSRSGDAAGSSYNVIDNSMVIGGGGSLTKGSTGTPAGEAYANTIGTPGWVLPGFIALGTVLVFLLIRK